MILTTMVLKSYYRDEDEKTTLKELRFQKDAAGEIPRSICYGCTNLETVTFLNEPTSIGSYAFANCAGLRQLEIPDSVTVIADDAFLGSENLVIYCTKDSYALQYAIEQEISYVVTDSEPTSYLIAVCVCR